MMPDGRPRVPKNVTDTYNQVRLQMRALVRPMCGELVQAADAIISGTTNRAVQRAALHWKIEGVPVLREALFQPDGFTAAFDTWVLCNQMADYFEKGPGQESLGAASAQAAATCRRMEEEFTEVAAAATVSGNVSKPRNLAHKWAAEHPIQNSIAGRESTLTRVPEREIADAFSFSGALTEVTATLDDLNRKMEIYSDQLFQQVRWEAELLKLELLTDVPVEQAVPLAQRALQSAEEAGKTFTDLAPSIERAVGVAESAPKVVAAEREAAVKAMHEELAQTIQFVRDERIAALGHVTHERIAALGDFKKTMAAESEALTEALGQISLKAVDHAFWRATQLVAVILLLLAIALAVVAVKIRKHV
jgi:hypothetical protein